MRCNAPPEARVEHTPCPEQRCALQVEFTLAQNPGLCAVQAATAEGLATMSASHNASLTATRLALDRLAATHDTERGSTVPQKPASSMPGSAQHRTPTPPPPTNEATKRALLC
jgi:hypothetical protein